jgi:arginase
VRRVGPARVGAEAAQRLAAACGRFWLSVDVDVLSDAAFPSTPVKQPGGLALAELVALCRPLAQHPACAGLDLLCYDPDMDDADRTGAHTAVELLRGVLTESAGA